MHVICIPDFWYYKFRKFKTHCVLFFVPFVAIPKLPWMFFVAFSSFWWKQKKPLSPPWLQYLLQSCYVRPHRFQLGLNKPAPVRLELVSYESGKVSWLSRCEAPWGILLTQISGNLPTRRQRAMYSVSGWCPWKPAVNTGPVETRALA